MRLLVLLAVGCWSASLAGQPGESAPADPGTVVTRAIDAHGGKDQLVRARADWVKLRGHVILEGKEIPFVAETWVQLPGQFKNTLEITTPRGTTRLVQIVNKDRVTVTIDGRPHTVAPAALSEIRETLHLNNAIRLLPLLNEPENYKLDFTGESKDQDRVLLGIKVSSRGRRDLRLYFDKTSGLLVRTEQMLDDGNGKEIRQETAYLDFRVLGGYKRPVKMAAFREGKKLMEAELTEVKYHDRLPEETFQP